MFGLSDYFLPLIQAIKLGDRSAFRHHLDSNMEWFRQRYIYLTLRAKGEVLVIRSLFRRACVPPPPSSIVCNLT
jgi:nuclear mRNA export protein PCID2/THP1